MPFRWSSVCLALLVSGLGISSLQAAGDFSLSATPSSRTIASGGNTTYTITVTKSGGFSGTVSFSPTSTGGGLPTGASASYSPATVTGSGSTTMTVTTTPGTTPAGTSTITVTGTSGSLVHTVNVTLVVTDFSVSVSPSSQTVSQGNTTPAYTTTVTPASGFSGTVALSITTTLPTGATATFVPTSVTGGSGSSALTISTSSSTPAGTYTLTVKGASGTLSHTTTITLIVVIPDFSVSTTPSSQSVSDGSTTGAYTTTVTPVNGFTGTVSFAVTSVLPTGATATFTPTTVTGGTGTSALTITTSLTTPVGTSTITISATSGTLVHTTTVTLIVTNAPITYTYDDLGRLSSVVDPTGATAIYKYDAVGNLLSITRQTPIGISSFSPTSGLVGTAVTITGTGFSSLPSQDTVKFNGVTAAITSASPTQIIATVPSSATTGVISVTSPSGTATSSTSFTVTTTGAPTISGFAPTIGSPDSPVTITGTNFNPIPSGNTVTVNGVAAPVYSATATTINAGVPQQAGSGKISVQTASGQVTSTGDFVVVPSAYPVSSVNSTGRVTLGASISMGVTAANPTALALFDGTSGQKIRLLLNSSISSGTLYLYGPDGTQLNSTSLSASASIVDIATSLPSTGTYTILVNSTSGGTGNIAMFVTVPLTTNDFAIFALPNFTQTAIARPSYSVFVSAGSTYSGSTITLGVSGLPSGASLTSFNPTTVTTSAVSVLTINPGTAVGGAYTFTVQGTNGTQTRNTTPPFNVNPVTSPWTDQDIGSPAIPGLGQSSGGTFTLGGSGAGIGGTADVFRYISQTLTGSWSGTIIARIATEFNAASNSQAGIMIRDSSGSMNAFMGLSGNSLQFQYRTTSGGSTSTVSGGSVSAPYWMKLVKSGSSFSAYASPDGSNWVQQGSTQTISMSSSVTVGLAVSSVNVSQVTTASFDNVVVLSATAAADFYLSAMPTSLSVAPGSSLSYPKVFVNSLNAFSGSVALSISSGLPTGATGTFSPTPIGGSGVSILTLATSSSTPPGTYSLTITGTSTPTHTTTVTLIVTATGTSLPSPWSNQDVGTGAPGTGSSYNNGTLTVTGTGCCLSNSSDNFQFAYYPLTGNATIIARLASEGNPSGTAKAGVMIRDSLAPSSVNVFMGLSGSSLLFQNRVSAGGSTSSSVGSAPGTPIWVKLVRAGNNLSGYYSVDGGTWIQQGTTQVIPMANSVYVGLAATSETSLLTSGTFDSWSASNSTPDFLLTTLPSTVGVALPPGGSVGYSKVYLNSVNGFSDIVNLSVLGLPTGTTATFNPASIAGSGVSLLTITSTSGTLPGNYSLTISGTNGTSTRTALLGFTVTTTTSSLPTTWNNQDIGTAGTGTGTTYSGGTYTVTGEGCCFGGATDNLQFPYQMMTGDGTIIARLTSMSNQTGYVGVMMRETLAPESKVAQVGFANGGYEFGYRSSTFAGMGVWGGSNVNLPYWLKLVRSVGTFSGYVSADGSTWTQVVFTSGAAIPMTEPVYVGLFASSNSSSAVITATFDNVSVLSDANTTPDFYLGTVPTGTTVIGGGGSVGYPKVSVDPVNGFTGTVSLSVSGLPTGATATFSPASIAGSGVSLLSITTTSGTPAGSYPLTITGTSGSLTHTAPLTLTVTSAATTLPSPWTNQDLGAGGTGTGSSYSSGTFTVSGIGCCLWNSTDSAQFAYQSLRGDGTIIARVASTTNFTGTGKAGVMIRETLDAGSTYAFIGLVASSSYGFTFQTRSATLGGTANVADGVPISAPYWFKLVRAGNSFSAYLSADGSTWVQQLGAQTVPMAPTVYVGLAVTPEGSSVATATFDNVSVLSNANTTPDFYVGTVPTATTVIAGGGSVGYPKVSVDPVNGFAGVVSLSVSGLPTGASATFSQASIAGPGVALLTITTTSATPAGSYPLTITGTSGSLTHTAPLTLTVTSAATTLPALWTNQDIGTPGTGTGTSYTSGTYTVTGEGCCFGGTTDNLQFPYQMMTGDGTLIARVASVVNPSGFAGLMIRETLDLGSKAVEVDFNNGNSAFRIRGTTFGNLGGWGGPGGLTLPYWLKLVRSGGSFSGYVSPDGSTWTQVGSTTAIAMTEPVYVGLFATSNSSATVTTGTFDNVSLSSTGGTPDFGLTMTPSTTTIAAGGSVGYPKVTVSPLNGFNGTVSLSVSGLPSGATATFGPAALTGSGVSLLTITTTSGTPAGTYPLTITGTSGSLTHNASLSLTVSSVTTTLPSLWTNQDLGAGGTGTGSSYSSGTFTVSGTGCCLYGVSSDSAQFAYQPLTGDGTIIARVASTTNFTGTARVGVMLRETLDPGSIDAFIGLVANSWGFDSQIRFTSSGGTTPLANNLAISAPYWFKLVRSGNNISAFLSADGGTWVQEGNTQSVPMATTIYAGLVVTSESSSLTTATFDNVGVESIASTTPDFYLGTVPGATTIAAGGSVGYPKVTVSPINGFNGTVSLSVSGLPSGATASFGSAAVTSSGVSLLTITTTSGTPAGTYPLTITGTSGSLTHTASLSLTVTSATTTLPSPWTNQDLGAGGTGTGSSYSSGTFTVSGTGCCLYGVSTDSAQFAYQPLMGDGTIIARVASITNFTGTARVGVMLRETLDPGSIDAFIGLAANSWGFDVQFRFTPLAGTTPLANNIAISAPYWFKLVRSGNNISAFLSADGNTWVQEGNTQSVPMAATIYAGLVVTSESSSLTTATFDNVSVESIANTTPDFYLSMVPSATTIAAGGSVGYPKVTVTPLNGFNGTVSLSVSGLPSGATASFGPPALTSSGVSVLTITTTSGTPAGTSTLTITGTSGSLTHTALLPLTVTSVATTLPSPWTNQDIGAGGTGTGSSYSSGTFTVSGTGCCLYGLSTDSAQFAYQPLRGDGTIIARVASTTNFTGTARVGVMLRETLDPGSIDAFIGLVANSWGFDSQIRFTPSAGVTPLANSLSITAPYWFKLVRSGNNISAFLSVDGITWVQEGGTQSVPMATTIYVGLTVTSESSSLTTATFDNVSITQP